MAAAQERASRAFGARTTFFLVNGTSCGLHAAVAASCCPGTVLLASRASHSAVFHAAALAGAPSPSTLLTGVCSAKDLDPRTRGGGTYAGCQVCLVDPEEDGIFGVAHGLSPVRVRAKLDQLHAAGHRVAALLATSPTYFGACSDVVALAQVRRACVIAIVLASAA